jgi:hypothetical protein
MRRPASSGEGPDRLRFITAFCVNNELRVGIIDDGVGLPTRNTLPALARHFGRHSQIAARMVIKTRIDAIQSAEIGAIHVQGMSLSLREQLYRVSRWVILDSRPRPFYIPECSARVSALDVDLT